MILVCSRGCVWDTTHPLHKQMHAGQKCPNVTSYDRMDGTRYCGRRLKEADRATVIQLQLDKFDRKRNLTKADIAKIQALVDEAETIREKARKDAEAKALLDTLCPPLSVIRQANGAK